MSYYSPAGGDYRTYGYAGDPGWLSSIWKGVKSIAKPLIGGMIGGPIGAIVAGGLGSMGQVSVPSRPWQAQSYPGPPWPASKTSFPGQGYRALGPRSPGWVAPTTRGMPEYAGGACPTGYHLAKDGSGRMVRNRRMNIANPRALRRAMRRVQGFEKLAKRTITFTRRTKIKKRAS